MATLSTRMLKRTVGEPVVIGANDSFDADGAPGGSESISRTVCLCIENPVALIKAIVTLDGHVDRIVLLSHALKSETVEALFELSGCEVLVSDRSDITIDAPFLSPEVISVADDEPRCETSWVMTTSGTTGVPKLITHTLGSLSRTVAPGRPGITPRWGLLYDPTRFAGMQVVLQALIGGGVLIAPDLSKPLQDQILFLAENGCTNLSATPTLWRRLLMAQQLRELPLKQITLGGEIVDQHVLDALKTAFPEARITHIYASTEAGVGFSVTDGVAGFPVSYLDGGNTGAEMKVVDEILWLKPKAAGKRTVSNTEVEVDKYGFIRSGDRIRITGDRAYFQGRDNGTINVGGVKIHPEMVEHTIMAVPGVDLVRISAKSNPISGALVVAEVKAADGFDTKDLKPAIMNHCRKTLEREATPAILRFVTDMEINAAGKLMRKK